jgi:NhaA family Na+:H+ antiporter
MRPLSAGVAVPTFAFFAAGVTVGGAHGMLDAVTDTVSVGIICGLVIGKFLGVFGTTYVVARFTRASLDEHLDWRDVAGVALLSGIGFTVSLLIGELAFSAGSAREEHLKVGVLVGSVVSAVLAAAVLKSRNRVYRELEDLEAADRNHDGIPDVYDS